MIMYTIDQLKLKIKQSAPDLILANEAQRRLLFFVDSREAMNTVYNELPNDGTMFDYKNIFISQARARIRDEKTTLHFANSITSPRNFYPISETCKSKLSPFGAIDRRTYVEKDKDFYPFDFKNLENELYDVWAKMPNSVAIAYSNNIVTVNVNYIKFIEANSTGIISIGYTTPERKILYVVDAQSFSQYELKDGEVGNFIAGSETFHSLGHTPAYFVSSKSKTVTSDIIKENPFFQHIAKIENYEFLKTLESCGELYAYYQTIIRQSHNDGGCSYETLNSYCSDGYLVYKNNPDGAQGKIHVSIDGKLQPCPKCNNELHIGSSIRVPVINSFNKGVEQINDVVKFVSPDITATEFVSNKLQIIEKELKDSILQNEMQLNSNTNHNERSVEYAASARQARIFEIKSNFEKLIYSLVNDRLRLEYPQSQITINYNLGTKYVLMSANELLSQIEKTKIACPNISALTSLELQLIANQMGSDNAIFAKAKLIYEFIPNLNIDNKELAALIQTETNEKIKDMYYRQLFSNAFTNFANGFNFGSSEEVLQIWETFKKSNITI